MSLTPELRTEIHEALARYWDTPADNLIVSDRELERILHDPEKYRAIMGKQKEN
jgi:hypothetical protein